MFAVVPIPIDGLLQLWPLSAATAIYTYMCVRGRTWWAWLGMTATLASCAWWAQRTGQSAGYGIGISAINLAPLLMATFFAWTIRPAARDIFALREQTIIRVAAEAADTAILDERDQQLRRLDNLARPLLQHLATDEDITDEQQLACTLLEAHLRDTLRAPILDTAAIAAAARAARARGVDVILLDDHGMDQTADPVREQITTAVLTALTEAADGTLTVRVSPPQRDTLLTILHRRSDDTTRSEYGQDGLALLAPDTLIDLATASLLSNRAEGTTRGGDDALDEP